MRKSKNKDILQLAQSYSRFGPRALFGQFMMEIAKSNKKLMVLSADLGRSSGLDRFKKEFPDKYLSVGISEQNLVGVAAGLAKEGYKVFVTSFAPFLSMRAIEQVRMNLGYMELPVNLVALGSGISMGFLGNSHYGLEDISMIRSIPNINISSPADGIELKKILNDYVSNNRGPSYIRLTGIPGSPFVYEKDYKYKFNKYVNLKKGKDLLILATGSIVSQALIASNLLMNSKIEPTLVNLNTLKPIDKNIYKLIKSFKNIVTIEEHSIIGGLSSIISEIISKNKLNPKLLNIALPDNFDKSGSYNYLLDYHGLTGVKIAKRVVKFLQN
jgi:transketolase